MSDAEDLYQSLILDHSRNPRNRGALPGANRTAARDNPLCGDRVTVSLLVDGDTIRDIRFEGTGCAISMASASMMAESISGHTRDEAMSLATAFDRLVSGAAPDPAGPAVGDLAAFAKVARFPVRMKCARLAWNALLEALKPRDS